MALLSGPNQFALIKWWSVGGSGLIVNSSEEILEAEAKTQRRL